MPSDHHFLLAGKRWLLRFTRLRGSAIGWTFLKDPKNQNVNERILIDERAYTKGRAGLELLIHELLHALNPTQSEEHVSQQGADIARVLWALGWRRKEDK